MDSEHPTSSIGQGERRQPDDAGLRQDNYPPEPSGASVADVVELLSEYITDQQLGTSDLESRFAHGVTVVSSLSKLSSPKGKVVILLSSEASSADEISAGVPDSGMALLVLSALSDGEEKYNKKVHERADSEESAVPIVWLEEYVDWAEIITLCRAVTAEGAAETTVGIPLGDIFALANSMATLAGGAISIVDTVGRVLGYSILPDQDIDELRRRTTLTLQEDVSPAKDTDFARLYATVGAAFFPAQTQDSYPRIAIAVRNSGEVLGSIWGVVGETTSREAMSEILVLMEPIVSQHLLSTRFFGRREIERTSDLVRALIHDPDNAAVSGRFLGLDNYGHRTVVRFRFPHILAGSAVRDLHRLHHSVEINAQIAFPGAVTALIDTDVIAILEVDDHESVKQIAQFSQRIVDLQRQAGSVPFIVGIGGVSDSLMTLGVSNLQALDTLAAMESKSEKLTGPELFGQTLIQNESIPEIEPSVGRFSEWRSFVGISYISEAIQRTDLWTDDHADMVLTHDDTNGTAFAATLLAYFRCRENVAATAKLLYTHHNTIRYRLSRAEELFGIDLNDQSLRLWLWLRLEAELRVQAKRSQSSAFS